MKRSIVAAIFGVLGLTIPAVAGAGQLDHLLCYRVKDPLDIKTYVNLLAEKQPEFSQQKCVVTKAIEFCVPATKEVLDPPAANGLMGPPLQMDYVCYNLDCPHPNQPPDKLVTDQFGQRVQRKYRPVKVCVPARKEPVPCGPIGKRQCGGACPDPTTQTCRPDAADQGCTCEPPPSPCGVDAAGVCGGECPTPGDKCTVNAAGDCKCETPPAPCSLSTAGVCGGTCPNPADECRPGVTATAPCTCQPAHKPCGIDANGLCGGLCTNPADTCTLNTANECTCEPKQCGVDATTGLCGGTCPNAGEECLKNAVGDCRCGTPPIPCTASSAPQCGGQCPAPEVCRPFNDGTSNCGCGAAPNP